MNSKLEGILENYLWKYVDKLDDTLEIASDKIIEQLDKHIMKERKRGKPEKKEQKESNLMELNEDDDKDEREKNAEQG